MHIPSCFKGNRSSPGDENEAYEHNNNSVNSGRSSGGIVRAACRKMGVKRVVEAASSIMWSLSSLVNTPPHVVFVGLESSGKSTILFRLKYGQYVNTAPTVGFNCEKVRTGGHQWAIWDVGGAERVRPLWRSYTRATDALIFVIDSSSTADRLEEAKLELFRLAKQQATDCANLSRPRPPILVLANKQDLPGAKDCQTLTKNLGLDEMSEQQAWTVCPTCAVTGEGLTDALEILHVMIKKVLKINKDKKS